MRNIFLPKAAEARAAGKPLVVGHYNGDGFLVLVNDRPVDNLILREARPLENVRMRCEEAAEWVARNLGAVFGGVAEVL
jgi:hypothetical protein